MVVEEILDIGCGTGPAACFLAKQGYFVDGIDVSRTAIEMAQTYAKERGLNIQFSVDDICSISETGSGIYDIISHLLLERLSLQHWNLSVKKQFHVPVKNTNLGKGFTERYKTQSFIETYRVPPGMTHHTIEAFCR